MSENNRFHNFNNENETYDSSNENSIDYGDYDISFVSLASDFEEPKDINTFFKKTEKLIFHNKINSFRQKIEKNTTKTIPKPFLEEEKKEDDVNISTFLKWKQPTSSFSNTSFAHDDDEFPSLMNSFTKKKNTIINEEEEEKKPEEPPKKNNTTTQHHQQKIVFCKSFLNKTPCSYGERCRYAHSYEELNLRNCVFGKKCKLVHFNDSTKNYINKKNGTKCLYLHPNETKNDFLTRMK